MATARKLPSGSYRVRIFSGYKYVNGEKKRLYESFTAPTKREAEMLAAKWAIERDSRAKDITVSEAIDNYIRAKENVLSPSTIRGYTHDKIRFEKIGHLKLRSLKNGNVQSWISELSAKYSYKTVKNTYGLLTTVLKFYEPGISLNVTLPPKIKKQYNLPSDEDVQTLLNYAKGTDLWICMMLARYYSLRRSEICALTDEDLNGDILTVRKAMIQDRNNKWVVKDYPKTYESYRFLIIDEPLLSVLREKKGKFFYGTPTAMTEAFRTAVRRTGIKHINFHLLRHMFATKAATQGIPDFFTAKMGGWSSNSTVLKSVYQNVRDADYREQMRNINALMRHEMET